MKKVFVLTSIFIILSMALVVKNCFAATPTVQFVANKAYAKRGETFTVTLSASCSDGLNGISTKFHYDSNVLELQGLPTIIDTSNWGYLGAEDDLTAICNSTTITSANIYLITFKVKDNAPLGVTSITTDNILVSTFASSNSEKIVESKTASINIIQKQLESISLVQTPTTTKYVQKYGVLDLAGGKIKANYNDSTSEEISLQSSSVSVTGFSNTTPGEKVITVSYGGKTTTFNVTILRLGDAKANDVIDLNDILEINKHRLKAKLLTGEALLVADVTNDGVVDIYDILYLNKFRIGKISSL